MAETKSLKVEVARYNPEAGIAPHSAFCEAPYDEIMSLLDALSYIGDNLAPGLNYRWSYRMTICGFCGMVASNVPRSACKAFLRDYTSDMKAEALDNFLTECDLVVDMTHFIEGLEAARPYIIGSPCTPDQSPSTQTSTQTVKYHWFSGCINCGLCCAACPQFGLNPELIEPVATTLAHRHNENGHNHGKKERTAQLNNPNGVWTYTFVSYCSEVCPKYVDPTAATQQGKVESSKDFLIVTLKPRQGMYDDN